MLLEPSKDQEPTLHGLVFVEEALKHYRDSESSESLTNTQAIMLIGIMYQCLGKDSAAQTYQEIAVKAAMTMDGDQNMGSGHRDQDLYFAQRTTVWGKSPSSSICSPLFLLRIDLWLIIEYSIRGFSIEQVSPPARWR